MPSATVTPAVPDAEAMIQEVYNMTGVQDLSVLSHAVNMLSTLDPVIVQTLGVLPQETLQQFITGNMNALSSQSTLDQFKAALSSGTVNIESLQASLLSHASNAAAVSPQKVPSIMEIDEFSSSPRLSNKQHDDRQHRAGNKLLQSQAPSGHQRSREPTRMGVSHRHDLPNKGSSYRNERRGGGRRADLSRHGR